MNINLDQIMAKYAEPHRHYHNWDHISRMLFEFMKLREHYVKMYSLTNREVENITTAIIYHDVIYDVGASTFVSNEQKSAIYFLLDQYGPTPSIDFQGTTITDLILTTEFHFSRINPIEVDRLKANPDFNRFKVLSQIIRDLDLLAFADKYEDFVKTNFNIDKEFSSLPFDAVLNGRCSFLQSILTNRSLHFFTFPNKKEMEATAYENIERILKEIYLPLKEERNKML